MTILNKYARFVASDRSGKIERPMTAPATGSRPFEVGTTGWTADDLLDPQIERQWEDGRYEII